MALFDDFDGELTAEDVYTEDFTPSQDDIDAMNHWPDDEPGAYDPHMNMDYDPFTIGYPALHDHEDDCPW